MYGIKDRNQGAQRHPNVVYLVACVHRNKKVVLKFCGKNYAH